MKNIFGLLFLFHISLSLSAQTPCSLDSSFATDGTLVADGGREGHVILVQSDGKILVAGNPSSSSGSAILKRFNEDGTVDATYGSNGTLTLSVMESATRIYGMKEWNGNIYLCGSTTTNIGGTTTFTYAAAVTPNGTLLSSFGTNGIKKFDTNPNKLWFPRALDMDASGNIYIAGLKSTSFAYVLKMSSTGMMDNSFDGDGYLYLSTGNADHWYEINDLALDGSSIVVAGKKYRANNGTTIPNFWNLMLIKINGDGTLDNNFGTLGIGLYNSAVGNFDEGKKVHVASDGKYIVTGNVYVNSDYDYTALKVGSDGSIDNSFGTNGWSVNDLTGTNDQEYSLNSELLPDGRILLTGNQGDGDTVYFAMLMLNADGTRDQVFAPNGLFKNIFNQNNNSSSSGLALTSTGKIILGGYTRTCSGGTCGPLYMGLSRYHNTYITPSAAVNPENENSILLFPNPAAPGQDVSIKGFENEKILGLKIINSTGQTVESIESFQDGSFQLPLLATGIYFCVVETANGIYSTRMRID